MTSINGSFEGMSSAAEAADTVASTENKVNDDGNDDNKNNNSSNNNIVPPLASHGITYDDLTTAIRVLTAVASLTPPPPPKKRSSSENKSSGTNPKKRKAKENDDDEGGDNDNNNNNNTTGNDDNLDDLLQPYKDKSLRPFRKILSKCLELHQMTMYDGKSRTEYYQQRNSIRTLKRQKLAERDMQRKHIASTALRRGRMEKLREKQQTEGYEEETSKQQQRMLIMSSNSAATTTAAVKPPSLMMIPDGHVETTPTVATSTTIKKLENNENTNANDDAQQDVNNDDGDEPDNEETIQLPKLRSCYVCKTRYRQLHHFYDQLCPTCSELNWQKRHQLCDLNGQVAVVTGSRVKIGYQTCLRLLRAGATVIATTRFPNAAVATYRTESDFHTWKHRLQIFGLDLRDVTGIEVFCRYLKTKCGTNGLDILINNACQTIRRPREYYVPACQREEQLWKDADDIHKSLLVGCREFEGIRRQLVLDQKQQHQHSNGSSSSNGGMNLLMGQDTVMSTGSSSNGPSDNTTGSLVSTSAGSSATTAAAASSDSTAVADMSSGSSGAPFETTGISHSAASSQMILLPEDVGVPESVLPKGATDINGQQLDLRTTNSWLLKMDEVSTPEVMECMFVNAIAPFVLNSRLKPLMCTPTNHRKRYIVNVSAMEGKFYRYKLPNHPHTNMAKAALNMMTRTSAEDLATHHGIYMNAIDTGWINDENPLERANRTAERNHFQTPIDEIDAAARIVDPIFCQSTEYGKFLKDYRETEW